MPAEQSVLQRPTLREYDRRRYQRVELRLLGRFMLSDRREYPCQTRDLSPGNAALITPVVGQVGEHVVAYLDQIGRIDGEISRIVDGGFAMTINATLRKKDRLAARLTWLANREILDLPEDRRYERIVPTNPFSQISLPDGRQFRCRLIDVSLSGAAIAAEVRPPIGATLQVGQVRARVVRHFDEGIAVEFATVQTRESIAQLFG